MTTSTSREFFEQLYRADPDPWGFEHDEYELDRYARVLDHIDIGRYHTAFEPGCSVGILTELLSTVCGEVLAVDIAAPAVEQARRRCEGRAGVRVEVGALPDALPTEPVDLIVFSEVGYYFTRPALIALADRLSATLAPGGRLIAAHWIGTSVDHVLHGREVHRILDDSVELAHVASSEHRWSPPGAPDDGPVKAFVLDVWDAPA